MILLPGFAVSLGIALVLLYFPFQQRRLLTDALEKRARIVANVLRLPAKIAFEFEHQATFVDLARQLAEADPALRFARVLAPGGEVFASFGDKAAAPGATAPDGIGLLVSRSEGVLLAGDSLTNPSLNVVVGLSNAEVESAYADSLPRALISAGIVLLGGFGLSLLLGRLWRQNAREHWLKHGRAELSEETRHAQDFGTLSNSIVTYVTQYVGAQAGALYVAAGGGSLALSAACGNGVERPALLRPGDAWVDHVGLHSAPLFAAMDSSGARTHLVVVTPLVYDNRLQAVLEVVFERPPDDTSLAFLGTVAEGIASAIASAESHVKLKELLHTTQEQSVMLHAANQNLAQKANDLELANRYKSEFLANMSHELRTPLNSLLILARTLVDNRERNLNADQVKSAAIIHKSGQDLLHLISDILDLSKVEAGKLDVIIETTEISTVIESLGRVFAPIAADRGLELRIDVGAAVPSHVHTDGQRLRQILQNLLSNAYKFTQVGSVTLRVRASEPATFQKRQVVFSVIDTGIGIPADRHRAIFEAFRQADGSTSRTYGGTGLGLTISRKLVGLLGGSLEVDSRPGEGSTFTVCLPAEGPAPASAAAHVAAVTRPPAKAVALVPTSIHGAGDRTTPADRAELQVDRRILLVATVDPDRARALTDLGRLRGYECVPVSEAVKAIVTAAEIRPSSILLDMELPGASTLRVIEQLKFNPVTRPIPLLVVNAADPAACLAKGALAALGKNAAALHINEALARAEAITAATVKKVLLVGSGSLVHFVENRATEVTVAATGAEARDRLRGGGYSCVVVEAGLKDGDLLQGPPALPPVVVCATLVPALRSDGVVRTVASPAELVDAVSLFAHTAESALTVEQLGLWRARCDPDRITRDCRLLLVDDDVRNLFALSKFLQAHGVHVLMADSGDLALARLDEQPETDVVLMDLCMPVMNGEEAVRRIRADPRFAALPIIALTSAPNEETGCLAAGAVDCLTKPVNLDRLMAVLRIRLFGRASRERTAA